MSHRPIPAATIFPQLVQRIARNTEATLRILVYLTTNAGTTPDPPDNPLLMPRGSESERRVSKPFLSRDREGAVALSSFFNILR